VNKVVADASAVIALLMGEPFNRLDPTRLNGASISAVNLAEVLTRLQDLSVPEDTATAAVAELDLRVFAFDEPLARRTALLRAATRGADLSLGDRACLALGEALQCPVVTADRVWANVDVGVEIILIR
jgi:PIN domain nuclease of toxin-antitoxin system